MRTNKGFNVVEIVLGLAIVVVLGMVGWRVWDAQTDKIDTNQNAAELIPVEAPQVEQVADLDQAATAVEELSLDSSDKELAELEKELEAL